MDKNKENIGECEVDEGKRKYSEIEEWESQRKLVRVREVGGDGYYYECVKCGEEGDLLCCDSCLCTYHLQCLSPPLKIVPMGYWYCPNCPKYNRGKRRRCRKKVPKDLSRCAVCSKTKKKFVSSKEKAFWSRSSPFKEAILHDGSTKEFQGLDSISDTDDDEHEKLLILWVLISSPVSAHASNDKLSMDEELYNLHFVKNVNYDKLCDVEWEKTSEAAEEESAEEDVDKQEQCDDEETVEVQELDSTHTQVDQAPQEKYNDELHARRKGKEIVEVQQEDQEGTHQALPLNDLVINNDEIIEVLKKLVYLNHGIQVGLTVNRKLRPKLQPRRIQKQASSSGPAEGQKQSFDPVIAKNAESVQSNASKDKGKGVAVECSLLVSSSGQCASVVPQIEPLLKGTTSSFTSYPESATTTIPTKLAFANSDEWSEEELNALWIGVRKHGRDNWEAVLQDPDPYLNCFKNKTPIDLGKKWQNEVQKMQPNPKAVEPTAERSTESALNSNKNIQAHVFDLQWCMANLNSRNPPMMNNNVNFGNNGFQDISSFLRSWASQSSPMAWRCNLQSNPSNISWETMVTELLVQTLNQKAEPQANLRPFRMPPFLTEAISLTTERGPILPRVEPRPDPRLFPGGSYPLSRVWMPRNAGGQPSGTRGNPVIVDDDQGGQCSYGKSWSR